MAFVPVYILILGTTIIIDYYAGIYLERTKGKRRRYFLVASLIANIGVLAIFKYYNFLNGNLSDFLNSIGYINRIPNLSILLPIGLSFHTFQAMSYTIEVYRGNQKAEYNFGIYALYVMFFPQLVAGPIERPQNLLHQFYEKHYFEYERIVDGLKLMLWGLFKKIVIADRLALYVNVVYDNPSEHSGLSLSIGTVFFAFQIYCDFSGYSDMAIGAAKILGFKLMTNFNRPYLSRNISEFWKRWHISLSTWFKDYLYLSLGGNRVSIPRWYFNLLFVFTISGLWHGANWTFIIWGALNGFYLVFAILTADWRRRINHYIYLDRLPWLHNFLQISITFILTCFAWIFFRANTSSDAFLVLTKIIKMNGPLFIDEVTMVYSLFGIILLVLVETNTEYFKGSFSLINHHNQAVRICTYTFLILTILLIGVIDGSQFIYFQF
ncbi:MAG TPA: MBOAT family O-acyltransferase [Paludibacter sp.]|nr:MBOAT family O-acyltransferase [Prolixibacteraceae bacterium]